jgi:RNA polymerase sigma-70 factor (sigma-E family)
MERGMRSGDEEDFVSFVQAASPRLLKAAWFLCGDPHRAEDLVQAALEKVYLRWGRLRNDEPLAYARRCLFTQQVDEGRRGRRELLTGVLPDRGVVDRDPGSADDVVALLRALPLRERQVVVMRYYADLPEGEVADLLGVSVGTVKSCGSRGLARLRAVQSSADAREEPEEESCRA